MRIACRVSIIPGSRAFARTCSPDLTVRGSGFRRAIALGGQGSAGGNEMTLVLAIMNRPGPCSCTNYINLLEERPLVPSKADGLYLLTCIEVYNVDLLLEFVSNFLKI